MYIGGYHRFVYTYTIYIHIRTYISMMDTPYFLLIPATPIYIEQNWHYVEKMEYAAMLPWSTSFGHSVYLPTTEVKHAKPIWLAVGVFRSLQSR